MIPCICVDSSNCPIDFPLPSQWLIKDREYHVVDIQWVPLSQTLGFKLFEKKSAEFIPYVYFRADRFVFKAEYQKKLEDMIMGVAPEQEEQVKEKIRELQTI